MIIHNFPASEKDQVKKRKSEKIKDWGCHWNIAESFTVLFIIKVAMANIWAIKWKQKGDSTIWPSVISLI